LSQEPGKGGLPAAGAAAGKPQAMAGELWAMAGKLWAMAGGLEAVRWWRPLSSSDNALMLPFVLGFLLGVCVIIPAFGL
jgi:hypothetical protein